MTTSYFTQSSTVTKSIPPEMPKTPSPTQDRNNLMVFIYETMELDNDCRTVSRTKLVDCFFQIDYCISLDLHWL